MRKKTVHGIFISLRNGLIENVTTHPSIFYFKSNRIAEQLQIPIFVQCLKIIFLPIFKLC